MSRSETAWEERLEEAHRLLQSYTTDAIETVLASLEPSLEGPGELQAAVADILNTTDRATTLAIHRAAIAGNADHIRRLHRLGARVDLTNGLGQQAIHLAAQHGHAEAIEALITCAIHVDTADRLGRTALHYAAIRGHAHLISPLAHLGAHLDAKTTDTLQATPACLAAFHRRSDVLRALHDHGANLILTQASGFDPLAIAASRGFHDLVVDLIPMVRPLAREGCPNPTFQAVQRGHLETMKRLVRNGYDLDDSALNRLITQGNHLALRSYLAGHSTESLAKRFPGWHEGTPLATAIRLNQIDCLGTLLAGGVLKALHPPSAQRAGRGRFAAGAAGASTSRTTPNTLTAIAFFAIKHRSFASIRYLSTHIRWDWEVPPNSPIKMAAQLNFADVVELLLELGVSKTVNSALVESLLRGHTDTLDVFYRKGVDVTAMVAFPVAGGHRGVHGQHPLTSLPQNVRTWFHEKHITDMSGLLLPGWRERQLGMNDPCAGGGGGGEGGGGGGAEPTKATP